MPIISIKTLFLVAFVFAIIQQGVKNSEFSFRPLIIEDQKVKQISEENLADTTVTKEQTSTSTAHIEQSRSQQQQQQQRQQQEKQRQSWGSYPSMNSSDFISVGPYRQGFGYSGMWWLHRGAFLQLPVHNMGWLEQASFVAFNKVGNGNVVMARDFLDFSVEHISRYMKMVDDSPGEGFNRYYTIQRKVDLLTDYISKVIESESTQSTNSHPDKSLAPARTITIMPVFFTSKDLFVEQELRNFVHQQPKSIGDDQSIVLDAKTRENIIHLYSLAATLVSLWRIGIPRVVVFGNTPNVPFAVKGAFTTAQTAIQRVTRQTTNFELQYVMAQNIQPVNDSRLDYDIVMPKHAIDNMQQVFIGNTTGEFADLVLGSAASRNQWNYVYFTEPDLLLHTRISSLPALSEQLDRGKLITAQRLQPLPHFVDFPHHKWPGELLPNISHFARFADLSSETDACCYLGEEHKPALTEFDNTNCRPWYHCGFERWHSKHNPVEKVVNQRFRRFFEYTPFIRLSKEGMGVPLVNEHGRVCGPAPRGNCDRSVP